MGFSDMRIKRLREYMVEHDLAALYVRDTSNIEWLTAFDDVFDDERAHAMLVDEARALLHTDSRYVTACERAAHGTAVEVNADAVGHAKIARSFWDASCARAVDRAGAIGRLGIEDSMALSEFRALEKEFSCEGGSSDFPFAETDGVVVNLRAVKDADEIHRMRAAQAITDAAFAHIIAFMKPGMTEREVQLELEDFMVRNGASGLAFSSIVATGANGASPHAIPGSTVLEAGQCVVLDFGARALGYCSDMTRTVFLGAPEGKMLEAWLTMRRANEEVEAMIRPGVTGAEAHEHAECVLAEGGFGGLMGHGLGHGVGIDIHEQPVLNPRNFKPLAAGNVVTVEPGIYIPGEFGMRLEDFGVVTDDGFDVFTESTHELVVL